MEPPALKPLSAKAHTHNQAFVSPFVLMGGIMGDATVY